MAVNVTEKDKTLNEIIDYCEDERNCALERGECAPTMEVQREDDAMARAFHEVADHCRSLLGYSGSMPDEVPNQSEDAK